MSRFAVLVLVLLARVAGVQGHADGSGVDSACDDLLPGHGVSSQNSPPPYTITFNATTYTPGTPVTVTLLGCQGAFKGFMIQARRADTTSNQTERLGTFSSPNSKEACSKTALVHSNSDDKLSVSIVWNPPSSPQGHVIFRVTYVKSLETFWSNIRSDVLYDATLNSSGTLDKKTAVAQTCSDPVSLKVSACGTTKGCFSSCSGSTCSFTVSWESSVNIATYVLTSQIFNQGNTYVALGFSNDSMMGNDSVMGCAMNSSGNVFLVLGYNKGQESPELFSDQEVQLLNYSLVNGELSCTITRPVSAKGNRYDVTQPWTLLVAQGSTRTNSSTGIPEIQYHEGRRSISKQQVSINSTVNIGSPLTPSTNGGSSTNVTKDTGCGLTKGCFSSCGGSGCTFTVSWESSTANLSTYVLSSQIFNQGNTYVALGFSSDSKMGDDSVMGCAMNSTGYVFLLLGITKGKMRPESYNDPEIKLTNFTTINGVLSCTITRPVSGNGSRYDITQPWTLLLVQGATSTASSGLPDIQFHGENYYISEKQVSVNSKDDLGSESPDNRMIKAHGCLMVGAWIFLASVGIVVARYYKPVWEVTLCTQKVWFQIHRVCMVLVFCATAAGFIIIFVEEKEWSDIDVEGKQFLVGHPIIGVIVMGLTVINPIMALFRPHPGTTNRPIFNWAHWFVGTAAHILAVIGVFFGVQIPNSQVPYYTVYILAAYVAWQLFIEILLELISCVGRKRDRSESYELNGGSEPSKTAVYTESNLTSTVKLVILVVHIIVVGALSAAVIAIIAIGEKELEE